MITAESVQWFRMNRLLLNNLKLSNDQHKRRICSVVITTILSRHGFVMIIVMGSEAGIARPIPEWWSTCTHLLQVWCKFDTLASGIKWDAKVPSGKKEEYDKSSSSDVTSTSAGFSRWVTPQYVILLPSHAKTSNVKISDITNNGHLIGAWSDGSAQQPERQGGAACTACCLRRLHRASCSFPPFQC